MASLASNSPAFEVDLVSAKVEILVREDLGDDDDENDDVKEDLGDLLEERLKESVNSLLCRVHRTHETILLPATIVAPGSCIDDKLSKNCGFFFSSDGRMG